MPSKWGASGERKDQSIFSAIKCDLTKTVIRSLCFWEVKKELHKKKLLGKLIDGIDVQEVIQSLKCVTLKDVAYWIAEECEKVKITNLQKLYKKIMTSEQSNDENDSGDNESLTNTSC